jgi:hypothetical protein
MLLAIYYGTGEKQYPFKYLKTQQLQVGISVAFISPFTLAVQPSAQLL